MSSQEMDCSEPYSLDAEEKNSTDVVEMTSVSGSLESSHSFHSFTVAPFLCLSECLEDGNEEGNDGHDESSRGDSQSEVPDEAPPPRVESPVSVNVSIFQVQVKTTNGSQEVSSDYGSQEFELNSEMKICLTLSRENSGEKLSNLKRKSNCQEKNGSKEKKIK